MRKGKAVKVCIHVRYVSCFFTQFALYDSVAKYICKPDFYEENNKRLRKSIPKISCNKSYTNKLYVTAFLLYFGCRGSITSRETISKLFWTIDIFCNSLYIENMLYDRTVLQVLT